MTLYKENAQEHELKEQLDEQEADLEDILKQTINFALSQKGVSDYDRGRIAGICRITSYNVCYTKLLRTFLQTEVLNHEYDFMDDDILKSINVSEIIHKVESFFSTSRNHRNNFV